MKYKLINPSLEKTLMENANYEIEFTVLNFSPIDKKMLINDKLIVVKDAKSYSFNSAPYQLQEQFLAYDFFIGNCQIYNKFDNMKIQSEELFCYAILKENLEKDQYFLNESINKLKKFYSNYQSSRSGNSELLSNFSIQMNKEIKGKITNYKVSKKIMQFMDLSYMCLSNNQLITKQNLEFMYNSLSKRFKLVLQVDELCLLNEPDSYDQMCK